MHPHSENEQIVAPPEFDTPIFPPSKGPEFLVGMIFRDTRPESAQRIRANLRKSRKAKDENLVLMPERLYLRVIQVTPALIRVISTEDPFAKEIELSLPDAITLVVTRMLVRSEFEPLPTLRFPASDLSVKQLKCRDKCCQIIQPLIDLGDFVFNPSIRWKTVKTICATHKLQPIEIYRLLRRYFQGGLRKNALAGRWFTRATGAARGVVLMGRSGTRFIRIPKGGRPRLDGHSHFKMTPADVKKIIAGAAKYYHTPDGGNWTRAWYLVLSDHYIEVDFASSVSLEEQVAKYTPETYPSYEQFRYYAKHDPLVVQRIKARHGEREYLLKNRKLNDRTESKTTGPGSHFQIDPTPLDVIVVHRLTRRPIGRITLYLVIDCFSHLIVGYYVHVGNAGYDPASLALLAAAEDKVTLCRRFGVEISPEEWPAACLCARLFADSELASLRAHVLVTEEGLELTITPAYRADLKGLVEALLGAAAKKARHLPGHTSGMRKRAKTNPDVLAVLDYYEVNQIVISWIRQTNRRRLPKYQLTPEMMADGLIATRLNLWNWGVPNAGGARRKWDPETLQRRLLPTDTAHITRRGLEFNGLVYEPNGPVLPEFDAWCVQRSESGTSPKKVTYHPVEINDLWLHHDGKLVPMHLAAGSREHVHWSYIDLDGFKFEQSVGHAVEASKAVPAMAALEGQQMKIIQEASKKTEQARGTVSQRRREKVDKPAERASQQNAIKAANVPRTKKPSPKTNPIISEEEDEIIANLEA